MQRFSTLSFMALLLVAVNATLCKQPSQKPELEHQDSLTVARAAVFEQTALMRDVTELSRIPHPFGSERQAQVGRYLQERAAALGAQTLAREFSAQVPNPAYSGTGAPVGPAAVTLERRGLNVWASLPVPSPRRCALVLASHYDSKVVANVDYLGANDSGSSAAALLALLPALRELSQRQDFSCEIRLVWFDGEEALLPGWNDGEQVHPARLQDNTYGSRYEAGQLQACGSEFCLPQALGGLPLKALILLDMIGSPAVRLTQELISDPDLLAQAIALDHLLSPEAPILLGPQKRVEDDHVPFRKLGVRAIDLIDFENLSHWHQPTDQVAHIESASIERVSRLALALLASLGRGQ